jgi:hypothetical protein
MPVSLVMFHVSDTANRESIRQHGLDWRRMGDAPGIAGSRVPEHQAVFLAEDLDVAKWFVQMGGWNDRHDIDVWEVHLDLDVDLHFDEDDSEPSDRLPPDGPLMQHADGYLCYLEPIPPERLKLVDPEALRTL